MTATARKPRAPRKTAAAKAPAKAGNGKVTGKVTKTTTTKAAPTKARKTAAKAPAKTASPKVVKSTTVVSPWFDKIGGPKLREESINAGKHRAEWTKADDKIVVSQKLTIPEIATRLNRSYHAVASRRAILKKIQEATASK